MFSQPKDISQYFFQLRFAIENRLKEIDLGKPRDHAVKVSLDPATGKITRDYSASFAHQVLALLRNLKFHSNHFQGRASKEAALDKLVVFVDDIVQPLKSHEGSDRRENLVRILELIREFETGTYLGKNEQQAAAPPEMTRTDALAEGGGLTPPQADYGTLDEKCLIWRFPNGKEIELNHKRKKGKAFTVGYLILKAWLEYTLKNGPENFQTRSDPSDARKELFKIFNKAKATYDNFPVPDEKLISAKTIPVFTVSFRNPRVE